MEDDDKFKSLELSGAELDQFIKGLVNKLYDRIWSDISIGTDEAIIKERLKRSIVEALKEYAEYRNDER